MSKEIKKERKTITRHLATSTNRGTYNIYPLALAIREELCWLKPKPELILRREYWVWDVKCAGMWSIYIVP